MGQMLGINVKQGQCLDVPKWNVKVDDKECLGENITSNLCIRNTTQPCISSHVEYKTIEMIILYNLQLAVFYCSKCYFIKLENNYWRNLIGYSMHVLEASVIWTMSNRILWVDYLRLVTGCLHSYSEDHMPVAVKNHFNLYSLLFCCVGLFSSFLFISLLIWMSSMQLELKCLLIYSF